MFSYSKISCYLECPLKYKLRYIDKLPEPPNQYLEFGTKFHEAIKEKKSENLKINLMVETLYNNEEFKKYFDKIIDFEKKYLFKNSDGDDFISFVDAVGDDFILEFKSSKDIWTKKMFEEELQSSLYIEAARQCDNKVKKFVYFIITKPEENDPIVQIKEVEQDNKKLLLIKDTVNKIKTDCRFNKNTNRFCFFCSFYNKCN